MLSPAMRRRQSVLAADDSEQTTERSDEYALMRMQLQQDRRMLHDIQSNELKAQAKKRILPNYDAWVSGALNGNTGREDDVLMWVMIWRIDAGDLPGALEIARYALIHNLTPPDNFGRTTATLIAEETAVQALNQMETGKQVDSRLLQAVRDMTDPLDMPDPVRARLYKASGYALREEGRQQDALSALRRALELYDKIGVKKDIAQLEKQADTE
ncbi:hypothetical protein S301_08585 [Salmonella enterica subsp. enterica]|uniref:Terminase n=1 Tax=Salmonella enterica I TaxID=59201 RepID=A0A5U3EUJ5_SALET|nr:hypothetical protein [Salmonella enterica subsp. enterica]